jgi:hypothetical protein
MSFTGRMQNNIGERERNRKVKSHAGNSCPGIGKVKRVRYTTLIKMKDYHKDSSKGCDLTLSPSHFKTFLI